MALFPGANLAFRVEPRTTIESGAPSNILPPPGDFSQIFTGGSVAVVGSKIFVATAPYDYDTAGVSANASRVVTYGDQLYGSAFADEFGVETYPDVTLGGSDAQLNAISDPHLSLEDYGQESSGVSGFPNTLLGVPSGQDVGWIEFGNVTGAGALRDVPGADRAVTTLTISLEAMAVRSFTTGPAAAKQGRLDVRQVEAVGTQHERLLASTLSAVRLTNVPRRGQIIVTGEASIVGSTVADLDGTWTLDERQWTLLSAEMIDRNLARVVLHTEPRTRAT